VNKIPKMLYYLTVQAKINALS